MKQAIEVLEHKIKMELVNIEFSEKELKRVREELTLLNSGIDKSRQIIADLQLSIMHLSAAKV